MKILELRFKNLNSLYGEWVINFADPEYVFNGIFALTGPTGSGKSTILDAVCLALYGATPRLGKITRSGNEIMSRQTGECYAEVLFESQTGRFRCHWEQRRARKKAAGNLQDQEHQIADGDTGRVIETKKSLVAGVIEEKTGMDFERFTRSILLAQGGFDTFLKAGIEQKSRILEQITGTEIYSAISRLVHERQRDEHEKQQLLQAEISGIVLLTPEQEKEIRQDLKVKQKQDKDFAVKSTETGRDIKWLTAIEDLRKEISRLTEEGLKLQADSEAFKPERARLEMAVKAVSLAGLYATLSGLRKQQADDLTALAKEEAVLPELEKSADMQAAFFKKAEICTLKTKEALKVAAPLIKKIRSLDQHIAEQQKAVSDGSEACTREATKIETDKEILLKEQKRRREAGKLLETAEQYLTDHAQDEWLVGGLAGIEEQLDSLLAREQEITQKENRIKNGDTVRAKAVKKLDATAKLCAVRRHELEYARKDLQQSKNILSEFLGGKLLREYRTEKETLLREMAYIRKIEELEDHRARLEDGEPCPLCGSTAHPFAEGNVPVPDKIEQKIKELGKLISKAEELEADINKLAQVESAALNNLNDSAKLETNAASDKRAAEKALVDLKDSLEKHRSVFETLKLAVSGKLQFLGVMEIPEEKVSSLLHSLKSRLKAWQEQFKQKIRIEKQIGDIDSEIKRLDAVIATQSEALTEKQQNLERLKKTLAAGRDERRKLYGDNNPDTEEGSLQKAIADADVEEKQAGRLNSELQQKMMTVRTHVESLKKRIEQRLSDLEKAENNFSSALLPAGFAGEKEFLEARMTNGELESLSARAKKLDDAQTQFKARMNDRNERLAAETGKKLTEKTLEELQPLFSEYEETLKALRYDIAGFSHKLRENAAAGERIKEKRAVIEGQKKECQRWEKLHALIGSADGKKYRNFAQGLTFELMISHANRQLAKMTDRYLLIHDKEQPLELNVVDNYQAGEIRSTRNLSGGESFIVSLTLALGLSQMASRKVRVDSLFLDEGFGTLDEDALETALETLSGLQQDGKLIGIISHVPALKERISTMINVVPVSGGKSIIAGPGCRKALSLS